MDTTHFYEPAKGHRLAHDPFKAIIAPRPIGWMSTIDAKDQVNLAPYSFFNAVSDKPPILMFAGAASQHSIANAESTGEFVFNLVSAKFAKTMNTTSAVVPRGVNEFGLAGLQQVKSELVRPPRVAGVPAAIECKVVAVHRVHDLAGRDLERSVVVGQAVGIHIDPAMIRDGVFDTAAARPLARCGYRGDYVEVTALFEMFRPDKAEADRLLANASV
jgi:flavin reductase (DIM6/NTAB) family NADH-FMN oxidoreductase RutF